MAFMPDVTIVFSVNGEQRKLAYREVKFSDWQALKRQLGLTASTLYDALTALDVEAFAAVVWLERRMTQPDVTLQSVYKSFDSMDFQFVGDELEEDEPDPTTAGSN